jgi:hypothetical protein
MSLLIEERDRALFTKITKNTEHVLYELFPEKKQRTLRRQNHNYILSLKSRLKGSSDVL